MPEASLVDELNAKARAWVDVGMPGPDAWHKVADSADLSGQPATPPVPDA